MDDRLPPAAAPSTAAPAVELPPPITDGAAPDPLATRVRRAWALVAGSWIVLTATIAAPVVVEGRPLDLLALGAAAGVAAAVLVLRRAVNDRDERRREEAENVARVLAGFSRAESPDAIVEAILDDLGAGTGADHLVVVRRRPGAPILDATLVPTRPGARRASVVLPAVDLEDGRAGPRRVAGRGPAEPLAVGAAPGDPAGRAAERIAGRVRRAFGLQHVLAAPLVAHGQLLGAIVISRRRVGPWPGPTRRLLAAAAAEASAALARTVTLRAAETAATTDALTGLPNRRYFEEYAMLLGGGRRAGDAIGILMIDIDRFKLLNDRHGHAVGDAVLRAVARAIAATVRDVDVPARFGGEEFVVLLRDASRATTLEVGERVRAAVERLDLRAVGVERVTVSVGATVGSGGADGVAELVEAADRALFRAKRYGRNRVEAA